MLTDITRLSREERSVQFRRELLAVGGIGWSAARGLDALCPVEGHINIGSSHGTIEREATSFVVRGVESLRNRNAQLAIMRWPVGGGLRGRVLSTMVRPDGLPWLRERTVDAPWPETPGFWELQSVVALREFVRCLSDHLSFPLREYDIAQCEWAGPEAEPPPMQVAESVRVALACVSLRTALDDLDEIALWRAGWLDGEGEAPDVSSLDAMTRLVCGLFARGILAPRVFLSPEGEAMAQWGAAGASVIAERGGVTFRAYAMPGDATLDGEVESDSDVARLAAYLMPRGGGQ